MLHIPSRLVTIAGTALLASSVTAQTAGPTDLTELRAALALGLSAVDVQALELPSASDQPFLVEVSLGPARRTLELRRHSIRSQRFEVVAIDRDERRTLEPGPVRTVRGTVLEDPGSRVAGSLLDDGLHALVELASGEVFWIEPFGQAHAVYRNEDSASPGDCGVTSDGGPSAPPPPGPDGYGTATLHVTEIATDADWEYFNKHGGNVQNRIETILNVMNVQYERDVFISYLITTMVIRTSSNDPYSSNNPNTLLDQVRQEWFNNQSSVVRDITQMFTGRNLQGSVIGIAYPGVICDKGWGYSVCQDYGNLGCRTDLSAHELGHNWNASHCSCGSYTMNASLTCSNRFRKQDTIPKISAFRDGRDCLDLDIGGTVLMVDDFESGTLDPAWVCSNAARCKIKALAGYAGSAWGLQLKKTVTIERAVSTIGFSEVEVVFASRSQNYESSEWLTLEWFDGGSWNAVDQWQQKAWREKRLVLPSGAGNNGSFAIRFSCNAVGPKERSKLDDVCVLGN